VFLRRDCITIDTQPRLPRILLSHQIRLNLDRPRWWRMAHTPQTLNSQVWAAVTAGEPRRTTSPDAVALIVGLWRSTAKFFFRLASSNVDGRRARCTAAILFNEPRISTEANCDCETQTKHQGHLRVATPIGPPGGCDENVTTVEKHPRGRICIVSFRCSSR